MAENKVFTSWRDLHNQLLNDLASGAFRTMQSYSVSGGGNSRQVTYRSLKDLRELIDWAAEEAAIEEGRGYQGRAYAKNGGRG